MSIVSNQLTVLDRALALERVGGDVELLQEMAQLFLEEYPSQLEAIRQAVDAGDPKALERAAHSLKGSIGNFGAAEAHQAAFHLELLGRQGTLEAVHEALAQLEKALQRVESEIARLATQS